MRLPVSQPGDIFVAMMQVQMELGETMKSYRIGFPGQLEASVKSAKNALIVYELQQTVDGQLLSEAVNKAMKLHPLFQSRLVRKAGLYCFEETSAEAVVKEVPWGQHVSYGTEEFHGLPWVITYSESTIVFTALHSLCDGMGMNAFMRTVFRYYFEAKGVVFHDDEGLLTPEDTRRTVVDPFRETGIKKAKTDIHEEDVKAHPIPDAFYSPVSLEDSVALFVIERADVSERGAETDTSIFAVLSALACRAFAEAAELEDGYVTANVAVDLRSTYGSITDQDFSVAPQLRYDVAKLKNRDLSLQATVLRSQLDLYLDRENLDHQISVSNMTNGPLCRLILPVAKKAYMQMLFGKQASLVYSHMTKTGFSKTIENQLKCVFLSGRNSGTPLTLFHGVTFRDNIYLNLQESSDGQKIVAAYAKLLDEQGIRYELHRLPSPGFYQYRGKPYFG